MWSSIRNAVLTGPTEGSPSPSYWFHLMSGCKCAIEGITCLPSIWFWGTDKPVNPSVNLWWILVLLTCCFPSVYKMCYGAVPSAQISVILSGVRSPRGQLEVRHSSPGRTLSASWLPGSSVLASLVHTSLEDANLFSSPWPSSIGSACCWHNPSRLCLSAQSFCLVNTT